MLRHDVGILTSFVNLILNSGSKVYLLRHCSLNKKKSNILFFGEKSDIPIIFLIEIKFGVCVNVSLIFKKSMIINR